MDIAAKKELAQMLVRTGRIREASYVEGINYRHGRYTKTFEEAAVEAMVDADMVPLIVAVLAGGFVEYLDWAEGMLSDYDSSTDTPITDISDILYG